MYNLRKKQIHQQNQRNNVIIKSQHIPIHHCESDLSDISEDVSIRNMNMPNIQNGQELLKFSDQLCKIKTKLLSKQILLESQKLQYDMFCYKILSQGIKQRDSSYVLSKKKLKIPFISVDSKLIHCGEKLIFIAKGE